MTNANIEKFDNEIIGRLLVDLYKFRIENPNTSIRKACEELAYPYESVLKWIKAGKLEDYIVNLHNTMSDVSQAEALSYLPEIVRTMAEIATGKRQLRGGNPQAAAEFVLKVAQLGAKEESKAPRAINYNNVFIPKMGNIKEEPVDVTPQVSVEAIDIT